MYMAIKANKNINTPPTTGKTMGMMGIKALSESCSSPAAGLWGAAWLEWSAGLVMVCPCLDWLDFSG
jgi:hypothetical protein